MKSRRTENEQEEAVTVNDDRYRAMLKEFLFTNNIWFQQAGATFHTAEATINVLRSVFEDCIISRRADVVGTAIDLQKMPILEKKIIFQMKLILI